MKKLLTALGLALALLFGGTVALAGSAAAECTTASCQTPPPCNMASCQTPPPCTTASCQEAAEADLASAPSPAEQTANDYRAQVVALTAKVERVQRIADRRAATIQRLRAKIRALR